MQYFIENNIILQKSCLKYCENFGKPKGLNMIFGEFFFFIFGKMFSHAQHDQHDR